MLWHMADDRSSLAVIGRPSRPVDSSSMLESVHVQCLTAFQQQDKGNRPRSLSPHVLQSASRLRGHRAARMQVHIE